MADAITIYGVAHKNGAVTCLARVVDKDAANITQADISSAVYSIYLLDDADPDSWTVVTGHDGVALTVADVIYDTLQTDAVWTKDATGYNFRHTIDRSANEAFATAGRNYLVVFSLTPASGQIIRLHFRILVP